MYDNKLDDSLPCQHCIGECRPECSYYKIVQKKENEHAHIEMIEENELQYMNDHSYYDDMNDYVIGSYYLNPNLFDSMV